MRPVSRGNSCLTLCDPMDCSPPASSVHRILQARKLEWVAIPFSRGSFQPRVRARGCANCQSLPHGLQHARLPCSSITNSQSLLKLMSTELVMPSNHLFLCHPLLLPPSIFPSIRVFSPQVMLVVKNPPANAGDPGSMPGSGRSPGGGHGNPLQYSCLENPMERQAQQMQRLDSRAESQ